jgi:hypothetical protein
MVTNKPRKPGSNPHGRTSKYRTADEFQEKIDEYFEYCEKKKIPYTVMGLAFALGFNSRQTLSNYEKYDHHKDIEEEQKILIAHTIKKAKLKIEEYLEENLITGKQVAGTIFNLKNNFGWVDRPNKNRTGQLILIINGVKVEDF